MKFVLYHSFDKNKHLKDYLLQNFYKLFPKIVIVTFIFVSLRDASLFALISVFFLNSCNIESFRWTLEIDLDVLDD